MKIMKTLLVATALTTLFGCASGIGQRATKFTSYEDFRKGPEGGVDLVWARIGLRSEDRLREKLAEYDSMIIDQVFVVTDEQNLDKEQITELSEHMLMRLKEKVSPYKKIVTEPSETTLRLSIAISNVETPNPILAVTSSVLPFGLAISTISKVTTGEHTNVGSASVELLLSDSKTGKPLIAAIDRQAGNKDLSTMVDSLDDAKDAIDYWVDRLGVTLSDWKKPE